MNDAGTQITLVRIVPGELIKVIEELQAVGPHVCAECAEPWQYIVLGHRLALYDYDQCRQVGITLMTDLPKWGADVVAQNWFADKIEYVRATTTGDPAHYASTARGCHAWLTSALWCVRDMARAGKFDVTEAEKANGRS